MPQCKFCSDPLQWSRVDAKMKPFNIDGTAHECPNLRAPKASIADPAAIPGTVHAAVERALEAELGNLRMEMLKVVGEGMQSHQAEMNSGYDVARTAWNKDIQDTLMQVPEIVAAETRKLIPVEHFIKVEAPDGTRVLETRPHMTLPKLVQLAALRQPAYLVGPAGGGKTTAAEQCAKILDLPFYARSMGQATTEYDLMGFRSPVDGTYVMGLMREPYENGGVLCLDEIDNSNASVLTSLNAAIDGTWASFPDAMVPRHKDFVLVAGANTYGRGADRVYVGRTQLDGATLNRFGFVEWNYDEDAELDWAGHDQAEWVLWVQKVRHNLQDLRIRHVLGPRNSIRGAALLRNGASWEDTAEAWVWQGLPQEDRERVA